MRALDLDFIRKRRPAGAVGLLLFAAGALTAGVILSEALDARDSVEQLAGQRELAERRLRAQRAAAAPAAQPLPAEVRAMRDANLIIARLAAPWPRLLGDTAEVAGTDVALTGLNPDTQGRSVRIAGVAANLAAVYAFIERTQARPGFVQVHLAQHDSAPDAAGAARIGFVVVAHWKEGL